MALEIHPTPDPVLSADALAEWSQIPAAIIGDELNRYQIMQGALQPLADDTAFAGLAVTVGCMVGDNLAPHYALEMVGPGQVLVIDARAHEDTAVWGEVMNTAAIYRGLTAVIIDGAIRDSATLRKSGLPVVARAAVPAGPHKGFGGTINGPIQCGGVSVNPGDLVVGDDDGVVVVRPTQLDGLLARCRARLENESKILKRINNGESTVSLMGLPPADKV